MGWAAWRPPERKRVDKILMYLEGMTNAENAGWQAEPGGFLVPKDTYFALVTLSFTVLAMGLNRNLSLFKEGSTVDNCVKLRFVIRFQNNKHTAARFHALRYHYSFTNSTWNVYRNRNTLTHRIKSKLVMSAGSTCKFWTCNMQNDIWGYKNHSVGSVITISLYIMKTEQDSRSWSLKTLLLLSMNSRAHEWLQWHTALNLCTRYCCVAALMRPVSLAQQWSACHQLLQRTWHGVIFCLLLAPNGFSKCLCYYHTL